jgi:membrane-associated phospholipid phosphatase
MAIFSTLVRTPPEALVRKIAIPGNWRFRHHLQMNDEIGNSNDDSTPTQGMRGFWWIALVFVGLSAATLPIDTVLADPHLLDGLPGDLTRVIGLSEVFSHGFGVFIVAIGIFLLARQKSKFIPRIVACAIWPAFGVLLVKSLIGRYRPIFYFDERCMANFPASIAETWLGWLPRDQINVVYSSSSFPSAHAATGWGLAIGLAWVFPKGRWLFFGVAALGSMQRVVSFAHWPSDVLCGAAIAFVMAGAMTQNWGFGYFLGRFENRNQVRLLVEDDDDVAGRRAA